MVMIEAIERGARYYSSNSEEEAKTFSKQFKGEVTPVKAFSGFIKLWIIKI